MVMSESAEHSANARLSTDLVLNGMTKLGPRFTLEVNAEDPMYSRPFGNVMLRRLLNSKALDPIRTSVSGRTILTRGRYANA